MTTPETYWARMDDRRVDLPTAKWSTTVVIGAAIVSLHELARRCDTLRPDEIEAIEIAVDVYQRGRWGEAGLQ